MEMVLFLHCFCSFCFSLVILIQMEEGAKDVIIYLKCHLLIWTYFLFSLCFCFKYSVSMQRILGFERHSYCQSAVQVCNVSRMFDYRGNNFTIDSLII